MDELIGLCRGLLADGALVWGEVRFLYDWLCRNDPVRHTPFGQTVFELLERAIHSEELSANDEESLVIWLHELIGGTPVSGNDASYSTRLPLDNPPPDVEFAERAFCFTGKFSYGSRLDCQDSTAQLGGIIHENPTRQTHFLVIGQIGSRDWAHSTHGRKIEKALGLKENGLPLAIIDERHWEGALQSRRQYEGVTTPAQPSPKPPRQTSKGEASPLATPLAGKTIVITGTFEYFERSTLTAQLQALGAKVTNTVSKKTDLLLAGDAPGSKLDKATSLGIETWNEAKLLKALAST
jgi:NAD-dependent DNA ligase